MFSHPLPSNPITMVMSPTGLSHISFLNLQSLEEQEVMHAHLLPFYLQKCFFSPNVNIPATSSPLSQTWVYQIVVQGILAGNSIYDSVTSIPRTFDVLEALQTSRVLNNIIGNTNVGPELPVSIVPETNPTASLPFYWRQALAKGQTT